jgi:ABC-2 type transport system ATP-binding protein
MNSDRAIMSVRGLRKRFGAIEAVNGLDFTVPRGCVCGFLGRNGAGKTTTLKMLLGMTHADGGEGHIFEEPIGVEAASVRIRQRTGFVGEVKEFYPFMTVRQIIDFHRAFYPQWQDRWEQRCLKDYELPLDQKTVRLSKGTRSKLALLLAFSCGADLLILDEPSEGLDPVGVETFLEHLVALAAEGRTVFFSSHQLDEVERVCERVCLIDQGQAVLETDLDELKTRVRNVSLTFPDSVPEAIFVEMSVKRLKVRGRSASLLIDGGVEALEARARAAGATSIEFAPVNLKEIFLETVGGRS